jgi:hypothetical protein
VTAEQRPRRLDAVIFRNGDDIERMDCREGVGRRAIAAAETAAVHAEAARTEDEYVARSPRRSPAPRSSSWSGRTRRRWPPAHADRRRTPGPPLTRWLGGQTQHSPVLAARVWRSGRHTHPNTHSARAGRPVWGSAGDGPRVARRPWVRFRRASVPAGVVAIGLSLKQTRFTGESTSNEAGDCYAHTPLRDPERCPHAR